MTTPTLESYEYQYMDSGVLLNSDSTSLPFIDITKVKGLDIPDYNEQSVEYDSRHGGFTYAKFVGQRTVVLEGLAYCDPSEADVFVENLKANFLPQEDDQKLYIKGSGIEQRYLWCKPIGFNYDIDSARSYGVTKIQIQLRAGDPTFYVDNADVSVPSGSSVVVTNTGKVATWPTFEVDGAFNIISFVKVSTGQTVTVSYPADADDNIEVNFNHRYLNVNGVRSSSSLAALGWWTLEPGEATTIRVYAISANIMVNASCESAFGAGYAVGSNWTGTQAASGGLSGKCLKMTRRNKTSSNGNCYVPTGLSGLPAGNYSLDVWVKGTIPNITVSVMNDATAISTISKTAITNKYWIKLTLPFYLASTSGTVKIYFSDAGLSSKKYKKGLTLLIDEFSLRDLDADGIATTLSYSNGWL